MSNHSRRRRAQRAQQDSSDLSSDPSSSSGHRQARLELILRDELERLVRDELADPALCDLRLVSLTLSPDGGHARVAFVLEGPLGEEGALRRAAEAALARAGPFLRARLAVHLNLKRTPRVSFTFVGMAEPDAGASDREGEVP